MSDKMKVWLKRELDKWFLQNDSKSRFYLVVTNKIHILPYRLHVQDMDKEIQTMEYGWLCITVNYQTNYAVANNIGWILPSDNDPDINTRS